MSMKEPTAEELASGKKPGAKDFILSADAKAKKIAQFQVEDESEDNSWGQDLSRLLEGKVGPDVIAQVLSIVGAARQPEAAELSNFIVNKTEVLAALVNSVNVLSNKLDDLKLAVIAGFAKADNDSGVTDTDYEDTVAALMS